MNKTQATTIMADFDKVDLAVANMEAIRQLHGDGLEIVDAAVLLKNNEGHVEILEDHRHPVGKGVVAGAVVGLVFPVSLVAGLLGGAAVGEAAKHLHKGLSRNDLRDLGQFMDDGEIMLVVVAKGPRIGEIRPALRGAKNVIDASMTTDEANFRRVAQSSDHIGLTE